MTLYNKNIILVVSGSIAAYKSPDIVRRLQDFGAKVKVVLTSGGEKFITKLSLEVVSKNQVYNELWQADMPHISLAKWADVILFAPISANQIANLAHASAKDLIYNIILATKAQIIIAPVMNKTMLNNKLVQRNLQILQQSSVAIIPSDYGLQVCGDVGTGRMPDVTKIVDFVANFFTKNSPLSGKNITITLGATIEKIDPVRYISNFSSGKMGVSLAEACLSLGARTTIIYGNIAVKLPTKTNNIKALSAKEMLLKAQKQKMDIFISCAAVSDYRVKAIATNKIQKSSDTLTLELIKNPDILATISQQKNRPFCVGFAAQTDNLEKYAKQKLIQKNLDMIVANHINDGFGGDENKVIIFTKDSKINLAKQSKAKIAVQILNLITEKYAQ